MSSKSMSIYLKVLAVILLYGGLVHVGNLLGYSPMPYSEMPPSTRAAWQNGDVVFAILNFVAVIGLWRGKSWGIGVWLLMVVAQLIMYTLLTHIFTEQPQMIVFHLLALGIFATIWFQGRNAGIPPESTMQV